jgi:hypothetical protein
MMKNFIANNLAMYLLAYSRVKKEIKLLACFLQSFFNKKILNPREENR